MSEQTTENQTPEEIAALEAEKKKAAEQGAESVVTAEEETVEIKSIGKDAEGNFVWIADPSDPKSTVYKGKTIDELLDNAAKGIKEKDTYIGKLKSQGLIEATKKQAHEEPPNIQYPDKNKVYQEVFQRSGIDPQFLSYTREQWKEHEKENGAVETMELKEAIRNAAKNAEAIYSQQNVVAINDENLDQETEAISEILKEYKISEEDFAEKYAEVLEAVHSNANNFSANGLRKQGRVVAQATIIIKAMAAGKTEEEIRKKIEEGAEKGREVKSGLKGSLKSAGPAGGPKEKTYKNTEEVVEDILAEMNAARPRK